jgi:hypothetical protein
MYELYSGGLPLRIIYCSEGHDRGFRPATGPRFSCVSNDAVRELSHATRQIGTGSKHGLSTRSLVDWQVVEITVLADRGSELVLLMSEFDQQQVKVECRQISARECITRVLSTALRAHTDNPVTLASRGPCSSNSSRRSQY